MALEYGYVVGQFVEVVGDRGSTQDADRNPDELGSVGTVTFKPTPTSITDTADGLVKFITPRSVTLTLNSVGKIVDANQLEGVFLVAGVEYTVTTSFLSLSWKVYPTAAHTLADPLDAVAQIPIPSVPGVKFVVNEQVYTDTLAAEARALDGAVRAETAAAAAEGASGGAVDSTARERANDAYTLANGKYTRPVGGIDDPDLADAVRVLLSAAGTAVQPAGLAGYVPNSRSITPGTGLSGGGTLSADRSLALSAATLASLGKADTAMQATAAANSTVFAKNGTGVVYGVGFGTAAAASTLAQRNSTGDLTVNTAPTASTDAASKAFVDAQIATRIQKGAAAIVYADVDPAIATAINNGASAYNSLGGKADLVGGVIPTSQLPALAISDTFVVASQAAMLSLTAQRGDVAKRSDLNGTPYILAADDATVLGNWVALDGAAGSPVSSVNAQTGVVVLGKADIGLGNADNTSDAAKPVSTAQQTALDAKAPLASPAFTGTPTGITKSHVGLANVDNTSDANKPVSTAQQTALNLKADLATMGNSTVLSKNSSGTAAGLPYAAVATASALALRNSTGDLTVNATPTSATDAVSKSYADARAGDMAPATTLSPGSTSTAITTTASRTVRVSLTAATTLTIAAGTAGVSYTQTLTLVQDATGGRTVTWPSAVKWAGGTKPTLATAAGAIDVVHLFWSGTEWIGFMGAAAIA